MPNKVKDSKFFKQITGYINVSVIKLRDTFWMDMIGDTIPNYTLLLEYIHHPRIIPVLRKVLLANMDPSEITMQTVEDYIYTKLNVQSILVHFIGEINVASISYNQQSESVDEFSSEDSDVPIIHCADVVYELHKCQNFITTIPYVVLHDPITPIGELHEYSHVPIRNTNSIPEYTVTSPIVLTTSPKIKDLADISINIIDEASFQQQYAEDNSTIVIRVPRSYTVVQALKDLFLRLQNKQTSSIIYFKGDIDGRSLCMRKMRYFYSYIMNTFPSLHNQKINSLPARVRSRPAVRKVYKRRRKQNKSRHPM
jgi:hypothetical protein